MIAGLIRRDFSAPMPGLKLVGDISCFATAEGWLYLATAVDLCSREVVGYSIVPHMRADLAVDAISAAHRTGLVAGNAQQQTPQDARMEDSCRSTQRSTTVGTRSRCCHDRLDPANTMRSHTGTRCGDWRSGRAPVAPGPAQMVPPPSRSSPRSRPRSAPTPGPTGPRRAAISRTGSTATTSDDYTPRSASRPPSRREPPGRSACR